MKHLKKWQVLLALALVVLSATLYSIHFAIFRDPHHIYIYLLGDIAFLPIEVLLVTIIIHQLLTEREKRSRLEKLNMVIGAFFSEAGTGLLTRFSDYDPRLDKIKKNLVPKADWSDKEFSDLSVTLKGYPFSIDIRKVDVEGLRRFLLDKREFLLRLLENPNLLEHERFTDMLWAVSHLAEELEARPQLQNLPKADETHIGQDIGRAFTALAAEWLDYVQHLKSHYPYLFSLILRTHPLQEHPSAIVTTAGETQASV
jgi:hypothetical protein